MFKGRIVKDVSVPENRINELVYLLGKRQIKIPHEEIFENWEISMYEEDLYVVLQANNTKWNRRMDKKILHESE